MQAGHSVPPRIVAVSKGQPVQLVQEAYNCGTRHFGESYVSPLSGNLMSVHSQCISLCQLQELQGKAEELKVYISSSRVDVCVPYEIITTGFGGH